MTLAGVQVRLGRVGDLGAIAELERAAVSAPHWPRLVYLEILEGQFGADGAPRCLFVAERDGVVVGFAVGLLATGSVELESVVVAEAARRCGIGRALCGAVLEWARAHGASEVALEVRAGSAGAIALYKGLGFARVGQRPRYYRDPEEDAVLMRVGLAGAAHDEA
jgi:ribosomal-protein-alanine N-acetyltransferase